MVDFTETAELRHRAAATLARSQQLVRDAVALREAIAERRGIVPSRDPGCHQRTLLPPSRRREVNTGVVTGRPSSRRRTL